jgi:hypothetical protein
MNGFFFSALALLITGGLSPVEAPLITGLEHLEQVGGHGIEPDVIIVGEWHGTQQAPAFVTTLAQTYARQGARVAVVLEQPDQLTPEYATAGRGASGRVSYCRGLRREMGWSRDGRASVAIAQLAVELSSAARALDDRIFVAGMDLSVPIPEEIDVAPTTYRRDYNAANIARAASQADITIVLVGNAHPPALQRRLVEDYGLNAVTIGMIWSAGEAWNCQRGRCQVHFSDGNAEAVEPGVSAPAILPGLARRHDLAVYVGSISASPLALEDAWCLGPLSEGVLGP